MAEPELSRRETLHFTDFREVMLDVENLQRGYERGGQWTLGQICDHLRVWLLYAVEGYPRPPAFVRPIMWMIRSTIGPRQLRKVLDEGRMRPGVPTVGESVFAASDADDADAMRRLADAIRRFETHEGEYQASPIFGPLDRDTARRLQLVHCAHHLSFLSPAGLGVPRGDG